MTSLITFLAPPLPQREDRMSTRHYLSNPALASLVESLFKIRNDVSIIFLQQILSSMLLLIVIIRVKK